MSVQQEVIFPSQPSEKETPQATESSFWVHHWKIIQEKLHQAHELLTRKRPAQLWSSERYFAAGALSQESDEHAQVTAQLRADMRSFFDEYALLRPAVTYQYGPSGMQDGYSESMSQIARNFITALEKSGQPVERAYRDLHTSEYIERWMLSPETQPGEMVLTISPRDSVGYPGLDERNYIFINIFEKSADSGFLLKQYRSYEPQKMLALLQSNLAESTGGRLVQVDETPTLLAAHAVATTVLHLPPESSLSKILTEVYARKATWKTNIDTQLPKLPEAESAEVLTQVVAFCEAQFQHIMQLDTIDIQTKNKCFDQLISTVREHFLKWTETHALNYDLSTKTEPFELDFAALAVVFQASIKEATGVKVTPEEKKLQKALSAATKLSALLPLKQTASWAHCIAGTPTSLLKLQNVLQLPGMGGGISLSPEFAKQYLALLSSAEKHALQIRLAAATTTVIVEGQVWHVPPSYLTGKGCFFDSEQDGVVGPCGILLSADDYAFSDEIYQQLTAEFEQQAHVRELIADERRQLAVPEQNQATRLAVELQKLLLVSSISPEQFLQGEVLAKQERFLAYPVLQALYESLEATIDPLTHLELLVIYHIKESKAVELEQEIVLFQQGVFPELFHPEFVTAATLSNDERSQRQGPLFLFPAPQGSVATPTLLAA